MADTQALSKEMDGVSGGRPLSEASDVSCNRRVNVLADRCVSNTPKNLIHDIRRYLDPVQNRFHGNGTQIKIIIFFQCPAVPAKSGV